MLMKKMLSGLFIIAFIISIASSGIFAESKAAPEQPAKAATEASDTEVSDTKTSDTGASDTEAEKADSAKSAAAPLLGKDSLEKVIKLTSEKLDIPENYKEFSSEAYDSMGKTMFRLRWYSNSDYYNRPGGGSLEVTVDENGNLIGYYHYKYSRNYEGMKKLPKLSKDRALSNARKFVGVICPDLIGKLVFEAENENCTIDYDGNYNVTFYRQENNIPFYDQYVSAVVDGTTGDITSFNRNNWDDAAVFPKTAGVLSPEAAEKAYRKNVVLQLKYRRDTVQGGSGTYLEYSSDINDLGQCIDAVSGEKVTPGGSYNPLYDMVYRMNPSSAAPEEIDLEGQELDEFRRLKELIAPEDAEKQARDMPELGLDGTYKLRRYHYETTSNGQYTLELEFMQAPSKENFPADFPPEKLNILIAAGEGGASVQITFDAKSGEILSLNGYYSYASDKTPSAGKTLERAQMQKTAEAFLKTYKSARFNQTELADMPAQVNDYVLKYIGVDLGNPGSFIYTRKVNGILYEDNRLTVTIDPATGKITAFSESWDNASFASTVGVMTSDKAYEALFKANPLKLRYVTAGNTSGQAAEKASGGQTSGEIKLVYAPDPAKPVCLDAKTGVLINYGDGQPYQEAGAVAYGDIGQHPAKKQIQALADLGVLPSAPGFKPDEKITQKEYLYILSQIKGNYNTGSGTWPLEQKDQDGLYRVLINDSTLDESEREPDACVTREDAVKYMLRAAGYRSFAELPGIFECRFTDKEDIDPALTGYAAIAGSLGIVDAAGSFEAKKELTKAEAVILLYRYLSR